ncbi:hypothetical protein B0H11DRAFT_2251423 [Mycena galericulata]|nr:hypothetical protein B0H11DRAFT_2251423 [Mycena galericulata]
MRLSAHGGGGARVHGDVHRGLWMCAMDVVRSHDRHEDGRVVAQLYVRCPCGDIPLQSRAISLLALVLKLAPTATFSEIESDLLPDVYRIAHSPLVSGAALDSLLSLYAPLVNSDAQIATHWVPNLVIAVQKAPRADASPNNVAKTMAQIDPDTATRATVVSAIRYIFAETSQSYDELLVPLLVNFLLLMLDQDLDTIINLDLIRTVEMGPWTHKVDDGLGTHSQQEAHEQIDSRLNKIASIFGPPSWDLRKRGFVPARLAVVIDGDTLAHALNPELKEMLLNLGT